MKPHVALIGLRASGKTTLGRILATKLARPFVDLDDEIARQHASEADAPIAHAGEILRAVGEPSFRDLESRVLAAVLARDEPIVLATGGGVVERAPNRSLLRSRARCIWLQVPLDELARRLRTDRTPRPALLGRDAVEEIPALASRRAPFYAELADAVLEAGPRPPEALAAAAIQALGLPDCGPGAA